MGGKGIAQLEIILAFVIFVSSVMFALYFFNPAENTRAVDSSLIYAINEIEKEVNVKLESYDVKINKAVVPIENKAISIALGDKIELEKVSRVESFKTGNVLNSEINYESGIIYFDWTKEEEDFINVYLSDDFSSSGAVLEKPDVNEQFYKISSMNSRKLISEKKARELKNSYDANYENLRKKLNLQRTEFGFVLSFSLGENIEAKRDEQKEAEIFLKTLKKEILRTNGKREFGNLKVTIW
ncbi:MAG: hypothetical protein AABW65_03120 [Nanoarchaeota archaeon]